MCHMLLFVKSKIFIFEHFTELLLELILNSHLHPSHER